MLLSSFLLCDEEKRFFKSDFGRCPWGLVNIFKMAAEVAALCKVLVAEAALEGSLLRVLAEVVPQVSTLLEDSLAAWVPAPEFKFALGAFAGLKPDNFMPLRRDSFESLCQGLFSCSLT